MTDETLKRHAAIDRRAEMEDGVLDELLASRGHSFTFAVLRPRRVRRVGLWRAPVTT
jgi:hypothetical protein